MIMMKSFIEYIKSASKDEKARIYDLLDKPQDLFNYIKGKKRICYKKENEEKIKQYFNVNEENIETVDLYEWVTYFDDGQIISLKYNQITIADCINKIWDNLRENDTIYDDRFLKSKNVIKETEKIINESLKEVVDDLINDMKQNTKNGFKFDEEWALA